MNIPKYLVFVAWSLGVCDVQDEDLTHVRHYRCQIECQIECQSIMPERMSDKMLEHICHKYFQMVYENHAKIVCKVGDHSKKVPHDAQP